MAGLICTHQAFTHALLARDITSYAALAPLVGGVWILEDEATESVVLPGICSGTTRGLAKGFTARSLKTRGKLWGQSAWPTSLH